MKRNRTNKASKIKCMLCDAEIASSSMIQHIRFKHRFELNTEQYIERFGDFRKPVAPSTGQRKIKQILCEICNLEFSISGFHNHLRDTHDGLTPDKYVQMGYTEYRPQEILFKKMLEVVGDKYKCLLCNMVCRNEKHLNKHLSQHHSEITKIDYIRTYILNNNIPKCECGCGNVVNLITHFPYFRKIIYGHGLSGEKNGMFGKFHNEDTSYKMKIKALERTKQPGKFIDTKPELDFKTNFLITNNIDFRTQESCGVGRCDFYLPDYNLFVEIDGEYWHPVKCEFLNIQLLESAIYQFQKKDISNLVRIRENDIQYIKSIDDLYKFNFKYNFDIEYNQIIIHKNIFSQFDGNLDRLVSRLYKFISLYQPTFPKIKTHENLNDVITKIRNYDYSSIFVNNSFKNNCSLLGGSYLKSKFNSYWASSFKGSKNAIEAWKDKNIMSKVIKYRIGGNNSHETFNFSLHQLVRGLSALRHTVSFFKPILAATIYKHFIGEKLNPVVFDPCCGFGGRLLGFKSLYPEGTYIGCEPNIETFNELMELSQNFTNVFLYNCKIEDFDLSLLPENLDLTFTSIPYYDLETYSNPVEYTDFEEWNNTFLTKIKKCPKLIVNIPESLQIYFENYQEEYNLINNTSHFNKTSKYKFEKILKI